MTDRKIDLRRACALLGTLVIAVACAGVGSIAPGTTSHSTPEPSAFIASITCVGSHQTGPSDDGPQSESEFARGKTSDMSIADFLETDARFKRWHDLAGETMSPMGLSWLEIWDLSADRMGDDREGVTVFVPTDAAFQHLEPSTLAGLEQDNQLRYLLLGHHYVHRLYPASDFERGPQRTWRGNGSVELELEPPTWGGCPILETDIRVSNGYVHVVGGVVIPAELRASASN